MGQPRPLWPWLAVIVLVLEDLEGSSWMEDIKPLQDEGQEDETAKDETQQKEEMKQMPFGAMGIHFLCNATQYAVFLGLTVLVIAIIQIFMPE